MSNIVAEEYQSEALWLKLRRGSYCKGQAICKTKSCTECTYFNNYYRKKVNIIRMPGMMDKGSDYLGKGRSNGTKSPSNASNGHFSDESGSDDEHGIASNTHTHSFAF